MIGPLDSDILRRREHDAISGKLQQRVQQKMFSLSVIWNQAVLSNEL